MTTDPLRPRSMFPLGARWGAPLPGSEQEFTMPAARPFGMRMGVESTPASLRLSGVFYDPVSQLAVRRVGDRMVPVCEDEDYGTNPANEKTTGITTRVDQPPEADVVKDD